MVDTGGRTGVPLHLAVYQGFYYDYAVSIGADVLWYVPTCRVGFGMVSLLINGLTINLFFSCLPYSFDITRDLINFVAENGGGAEWFLDRPSALS